MRRIKENFKQVGLSLFTFCLIGIVGPQISHATQPVDQLELEALLVEQALDRAIRHDDGVYVIGLYERTWRKHDPDGTANPFTTILGLALALPTMGESLSMIPNDIPPTWIPHDRCAFYAVDDKAEARDLVRRFMIDTRPNSPHIRTWEVHGRYAKETKATSRKLRLQRSYAHYLILEQQIELTQRASR